MVYSLCTPYNYLPPGDVRYVSEHINKFGLPRYISVVTFNYSYTFEKLFCYNDQILKLPHIADSYLKTVLHIHGTFERGLIIGVNDENQIKNTDFQENNNIVNALVKPQNNQSSARLIDEECISRLKDANLICIFGSSLGKTDKFWWEIIKEQLLNRGVLLIIFYKGEDISELYNYKELQAKDRVKDLFLDAAGVDDEIRHALKNKIFVVYNSDAFKIGFN